MWEIIRAGGGFMWPIILCSVASVAIILERLWTLQSSRVIPRDLSQKVWNWIEADQLSEKLVLALEHDFADDSSYFVVTPERPRAPRREVEQFRDWLKSVAALDAG